MGQIYLPEYFYFIENMQPALPSNLSVKDVVNTTSLIRFGGINSHAVVSFLCYKIFSIYFVEIEFDGHVRNEI